MRFAALSIGSLALVALTLPGLAHAETVTLHQADSSSSSIFPYFRRGTGAVLNPQPNPSSGNPAYQGNTVSGWASSTQQVAAVDPLANFAVTPEIGMDVRPDRDEAFAGDTVVYCLCVKNMYRQPLGNFDVAFFYDPNLMIIEDSGGGRIEGNHIRFTVPTLQPGEKWTRHITVRLPKNLRGGAVLRTYGSLVENGVIAPACSKHDLTIVQPPHTGADVGLIENLMMGSVALSGTGIGIGIGRKKIKA